MVLEGSLMFGWLKVETQFFKIENWNFQHLFEKENRKTSQNFNSIRQPIEKMEIQIIWMSWMSWNFVRFHEIQFQIDAESFSFLSWKTKMFYSKKKFFRPLSISKQKSFVYWPNFQWKFWCEWQYCKPVKIPTFCLRIGTKGLYFLNIVIQAPPFTFRNYFWNVPLTIHR